MLSNSERELIAGRIQIPESELASPSGARIAADWVRYRWSLIYARMSPCARDCVEDLTRLAQVVIALGKDRDRVQRVFLTATAAGNLKSDPTLTVGLLAAAGGRQRVGVLGADRYETGSHFHR
jgi:hypothetical protein